jgi:GNAT superfamily N-acetyltransferase
MAITYNKYPFSKQGDSNFKFIPTDIVTSEYKEMFTNFFIDYSKTDNCGSGSVELGDRILESTYLINIDNKTVGFIKISAANGVVTANAIHVVYVKPEYRGFGIAKRTYQHAIQNYNCKLIQISYGRCSMLSQIEMWRSVGFIGAIMVPAQSSTRGLVVLTTELNSSPLCFNLDKKGIQKCQYHSEKIQKKLWQKHNECYSAGEVLSGSIDTLDTVIDNHFRLNAKQTETA